MIAEKTIFVTSFHILVSRNILASPLFEFLLGRGFRIVLLVPEEKVAFFEREFGRAGVVIEGIARKLVRSDIFLRYLALAGVRTNTLAIKRRTEMRRSGIWLSWLIGNNPFWRWFFRKMDSWFTPRDRFVSLFNRYQPALVFATDVQNENDVRLIHEARDRGIPIVGMVRSWDNLTAKGLIRALPDVLVVNNDIVKNEAQRFHGVPDAMVRVVGIPHYDRYILPPLHARHKFAKIVGLDSEKRWVVYAPTGDRYLGENRIDREVIEFLAEHLPVSHQLLVRFPPSDSVNIEGLRLGSGVITMRPGAALSGIGTFKNNELTPADDELLRDTLAYVDLVITGPSTFVIDAAVFDKPIILVGFDGRDVRPYYESIRRYYDYDHFRPIRETGGVKIVDRIEDLESSVIRYLQHPDYEHEGRKNIVSRECGKLDGRSSERLLQVIISVIKDRP